MSEPSENPAELQASTKRRIRWDALAAIIAALIGLLALCVSGYTAYIERQQVRAQVWPRLALGYSNGGGHYELTALNQGVGPAIVQSVQVLVSGKPVSDWDGLEKLFGFKPTSPGVVSTLNNMVLTPGEHLRWIQFRTAADIDAFMADWARFHVETRVCYSSTLGESWLLIYRAHGTSLPRPVPGCPKLPDQEQFHG